MKYLFYVDSSVVGEDAKEGVRVVEADTPDEAWGRFNHQYGDQCTVTRFIGDFKPGKSLNGWDSRMSRENGGTLQPAKGKK